LDASHGPRGIICSVVTPFDSDGRIDQGALRALLDIQLRSGTHGLFLLGTAGEGILLSTEERMRVVDAAISHVADRIPVVVHCGAADTKTACMLAQHASSAGATAEASVAPFFFAYGADAVVRHFGRIAESAPEIGHYVYENPERVGYSVGVSTVVRLVRDVPAILGVKDTGDSLARIGRYLSIDDPAIEVYAGNNEIVVAALAAGARGAVSAIASAAPELMVALYAASTRGDSIAARSLQRTVARLHTCIDGMPYLAAIKHLAKRRGLPAGAVRPPQLELTPQQAAELGRRLDAAPDLDRWLERLEGASASVRQSSPRP
jgi:dihydrodipicolinate synthase/N-acetylneuraminate lyase